MWDKLCPINDLSDPTHRATASKPRQGSILMHSLWQQANLSDAAPQVTDERVIKVVSEEYMNLCKFRDRGMLDHVVEG